MGQAIQALGINWQDLLINAIGFLVLVVILRRLFWDRVREFFDQRAQQIARNLEEAERARDAMRARERELEQRLAQIESEAREAIQQATQEAHKARERILSEARERQQELIARAQEEIQREWDKARVEMRDAVADLAVELAERALRQTIDEQRHRELITSFFADLDALDRR
jgi:F-type H+-transporting ATPase subunit b